MKYALNKGQQYSDCHGIYVSFLCSHDLTAGGSEGPRLRTATGPVTRATTSVLFRRIFVSIYLPVVPTWSTEHP
jgi:hypothetical protein